MGITLQLHHFLWYCLYRGGFYPGTGAALNVGHGAGEGYSVNVPWNCGDMGDDDYVAAMEHVVLPIATEYNPDIIIISAGFDAAEGDPLGTMLSGIPCLIRG